MKAREYVVCLACAVAALALPAAALARPSYRVRPPGTEMFIELEKSDYEFSVETNDRQRILLAVEEGLFSATEYSTKGHVSSKRIEADFGDLGHVDVNVRLAPGQSRRLPPGKGCRGPGSIYVPGTFRGTIEYSGEGDLPALSVTHGEIGFIRRFKRVCKSPQPATGQGHKKKRKRKLDVNYLAATGKGEGRTVVLEAIDFALKRSPARSFGLLFVGDYEKREEVRIERIMLEFFGPESFKVSKRGKQPEIVRVDPPQPFAGRGIYSHSSGSPPNWTGDLRVDLLGIDGIPLAGPDFDAAFCRGSSLAAAERCLYDSGSRSRPLTEAKLSAPLISFRDDFFHKVLDTHPEAVKAFSGPFH